MYFELTMLCPFKECMAVLIWVEVTAFWTFGNFIILILLHYHTNIIV